MVLPTDNPLTENAPPRPARLAIVLAWACLLLAAGELAVRGPARALVNSPDFALYYCSTRAMLSGTDPYDLRNLQAIAQQTGAPSNLLQYAIAPPISYVPIAPFAMLDWPLARTLWLLFNLLMTALLVTFLAGRAGLKVDASSPRAVFVVAMVLGLAPLQTSVGLGQLAVISAGWLAAALYSQHRNRPLQAGLMLGLAACFKPQMILVFLAYWLVCRKWKGLAAAACVGLVAAAFAAIKLGPSGFEWFQHWQQNIQNSVNEGIADYANPAQQHNFVNLQYPLYVLFGSRALANAIAWGLSLALLTMAAWAWRRTPRPARDERLLLGLLATAGLLPVYHVWYDAVLLAVPLFWALAPDVSGRRPVADGQSPGPARAHALTTFILILPFLIPGPAMLTRLGPDRLTPEVWNSWWFQGLVMPYQAYLIAAIAIVLLLAMFRRPGALSFPADAPDASPAPQDRA